MPTFVASLASNGALIQVEFGLIPAQIRQLRQAHQPIPAGLRVSALLDTGAEGSTVDSRALTPLIQAANLPPYRVALASLPTAGGTTFAVQYRLSVTILHPSGLPGANHVVDSLPILDLPVGHLGYDAVLGRDVLDTCMFVWDGPSRTVTLAY